MTATKRLPERSGSRGDSAKKNDGNRPKEKEKMFQFFSKKLL